MSAPVARSLHRPASRPGPDGCPVDRSRGWPAGRAFCNRWDRGLDVCGVGLASGAVPADVRVGEVGQPVHAPAFGRGDRCLFQLAMIARSRCRPPDQSRPSRPSHASALAVLTWPCAWRHEKVGYCGNRSPLSSGGALTGSSRGAAADQRAGGRCKPVSARPELLPEQAERNGLRALSPARPNGAVGATGPLSPAPARMRRVVREAAAGRRTANQGGTATSAIAPAPETAAQRGGAFLLSRRRPPAVGAARANR